MYLLVLLYSSAVRSVPCSSQHCVIEETLLRKQSDYSNIVITSRSIVDQCVIDL